MFLSASVSACAKREYILNRAARLGCRCPSEPTMNRFTSLCLVVNGESDLSAVQKHASMLQMKAQWKQMNRRLLSPRTHVVSLPESAEELELHHPDIFAEAYSDSRPVPCKVNVIDVVACDRSFKCRGANLLLRCPTLQLASPSCDMKAMLSLFMNGWSQLQQQNRYLTIGGEGGGDLQLPNVRPPLRALAALPASNTPLKRKGLNTSPSGASPLHSTQPAIRSPSQQSLSSGSLQDDLPTIGSASEQSLSLGSLQDVPPTIGSPSQQSLSLGSLQDTFPLAPISLSGHQFTGTEGDDAQGVCSTQIVPLEPASMAEAKRVWVEAQRAAASAVRVASSPSVSVS